MKADNYFCDSSRLLYLKLNDLCFSRCDENALRLLLVSVYAQRGVK